MTRARDARVADAAALAAIHVRSWQVAYAGIFPAEFLSGLDVGRRERWRRARLQNPPPRTCTLVVEVDDGPIGFADLGPALGLGGAGEVYAIYLDPDHWGRGHGRELMAAAVDRLVRLGCGEAVLWVIEENLRARRFYEAAGWADDGARRIEEIGGVQVNELRYRRPLRVRSRPTLSGSIGEPDPRRRRSPRRR